MNNYIEQKLQQLREDYKKYPEHRFKIALQAKVLKMTPAQTIDIQEVTKPTQLYNDVKDSLT